MNRRAIVLLVLILALLAGLVGFYLYLSGEEGGQDADATAGAEGLVHVRTIFTADGENLRRPTGIGADANGDFYITLKDNGRIIGFDRSGDTRIKWGESGIEKGQMLAPLSVAADRLSNQVYVVDRARLRIICYNSAGQFQWEQAVLNPNGVSVLGENLAITTFGPIVLMSREGEVVSETGARGHLDGEFDYPRAAVQAPEGDDLIVADTNNTRVQRVQLNGEATATAVWVAGNPPRYQDDPETLWAVPSGITTDDRGRIFVLDGFRHKIDVLDADTGEIIHTFDELDGDADGRFNLPTGIANLGGDYFAITDTFNDRVQIIRLLLPGEDTIFARTPWLIYLLPLLLLPLLLLLLRRRVFVTREALEAAAADENLRLLASAFRRLYVLPEVADDFEAITEKDVELKPYFVDAGPRTEQPDAGDELQRLAAAASPSGLRRLTSPRRLIVCVDEKQVAEFEALTSAKARDYAWVTSEYRLSQ